MARLSNLRPRVQVAASRLRTLVPSSWHITGANANARGYTRTWQKARLDFLRLHPLCQCPDCQEGKRRVTRATVVDHIIPHRGDPQLFWDRENNWQALAKSCHDRKTQLEGGAGAIGPSAAVIRPAEDDVH